MSLRVYNSLSREKEPFAPLVDGRVGVYLCGPTVYKPPHLGHLVGPVIFDTIKRYLTFKGYAVNWVVNVTDVDDKIIAEAERRGMTFAALAEEQTALYFDVLDRLGVRNGVDHFPRASAHMSEIVAMIERLIATNFAYAPGDGNVWFAVDQDPGYGKLSRRKTENNEGGGRALTGLQSKRSPDDFALWKAAKPGEPSWPSPWGGGRPGWHIECSAMSAKFLGDTFDIHGGGDDLKFPHHENELAQSECCHGKPLAKYWFHNGLTKIRTKAAGGEWRDEKMSKSLGNTIDAAGLLDAHGPDVLRYLLLSTHYRSPIEFSDEALDNTKKALGAFTRVLDRTARLRSVASPAHSDIAAAFEAKFVASMDDDFNTAGAIAALHELAGAINGEIEKRGVESTGDPTDIAAVTSAAARFRALAALLGLTFAPPAKKDDGLADPLMRLIIRLRAEARRKKDFATADAIRDGLNELKITLEDKKDGTVWRQG